MEAFQQHTQWRVVCAANGQERCCNEDEHRSVSAEATASQFVWAEYERLDWERIYAGVTPLVPDKAQQLEGCLIKSREMDHPQSLGS